MVIEISVGLETIHGEYHDILLFFYDMRAHIPARIYTLFFVPTKVKIVFFV